MASSTTLSHLGFNAKIGANRLYERKAHDCKLRIFQKNNPRLRHKLSLFTTVSVPHCGASIGIGINQVGLTGSTLLQLDLIASPQLSFPARKAGYFTAIQRHGLTLTCQTQAMVSLEDTTLMWQDER